MSSKDVHTREAAGFKILQSLSLIDRSKSIKQYVGVYLCQCIFSYTVFVRIHYAVDDNYLNTISDKTKIF